MTRILFVDDERLVLDGLRDSLRRRRRDWEMVFATGAEAALAELGRGTFDIIVTDLRMPGMNGGDLLRLVQRDHPHIIRIVLSGHAELRSALSAVSVVHQYLSKPISAEVLQGVIERAARLHAVLGDPLLRDVVGRMRCLPARPRIYSELTELLRDPEVSSERIAQLISQDVALTAEVLRVVNSAYFKHAQRIHGIRNAVSFLGSATIGHLVLSIEVGRALGGDGPMGRHIEQIQRHSLQTARLAAKLLGDPRRSEHAFLAGLLLDVGLLLLCAEEPAVLQATLSDAAARGLSLHRAERERRGVTHADVGAYLLGLWDFPCDVVEAVAYHHSPSKDAPGDHALLAAVHAADALLGGHLGARGPEGELELAYLEAVGAAGELPRWRGLAAAQQREDEGT